MIHETPTLPPKDTAHFPGLSTDIPQSETAWAVGLNEQWDETWRLGGGLSTGQEVEGGAHASIPL